MLVRIPHQIARFRCLFAATLLLPIAAGAQSSGLAEPVVAEAPAVLASVVVPESLEAIAPSVSAPAAPSAAAPDASSFSSSLPDDPATILAAQQDPKASLPPSSPQGNGATGGPRAPKYAYDISADEQAQLLTTKEKIALGFRHLYDPFGLIGVVVSAGYSQATNGQPNYGTDKGAFGQRLGAAELRNISEDIFTDTILHPLMHTDPRYYVKGPKYSFLSRSKYAVTRLFITKKDDGGHTVNSALLLGYLESASMTRFYYPQNNKNFKDLMTGYGGSLGGEAIAFLATEFSDSILRSIHLKL